jgi:ATP-dependent RNA helicase SUPV3L1/SUV3
VEPDAESCGELDEGSGPQKAVKDSPSSGNVGLVTTLDPMDLPHLTKAIRREPEPVMSAGIFPPTSVITRFAAYFPDETPFSYILLRLHELSLIHPRFRLCQLRDQVLVADAIEPVRNLTIKDRLIFCAAPASIREHVMKKVVQAYARCVANSEGGALLDIPELDLDLLDENITIKKPYLFKLEVLHKALVLYLWLSYRFAGVFTSQAMAFYVKGIVEKNIHTVLTAVSSTKNLGVRIKKPREQTIAESGKQLANGTWFERGEILRVETAN